MPETKDTARVLSSLAEALGAPHVLTDPAETAGYLVERRGLYVGAPLAVVRPADTAQVAAVMRICHAARVPVVPQGGNTGLVGGQIPDQSGRELVLSTQRLDRIREVDKGTASMTCESGVTLQRAQEAAADVGRLFPLSLAAQGTATVGGILSTNAGGTQVLSYGTARDLVLGLEVVLADGRVWRGLRKLRKDNTGYDMRHLFVGAEGTLGIVTAAVLKLFPAPGSIETAWIAVESPEQALALLDLARERAGSDVTSFELMQRICIDMVVRHIPGTRDPLPGYSWYVLLEISAQARSVRDELEALLSEGMARGLVVDAVLADSLTARHDFWKVRESISDAQRSEGGSIKHDVSVPVGAVPAFLIEARAAVEKFMPGVRPVPFGHLGDGNIHFNVSQPIGADKDEYIARWDEMNAVVHDLVLRHGGSISAEHGIGRLKRPLMPQVKDPVELEMMRAIKVALDPLGLMNPGKVL